MRVGVACISEEGEGQREFGVVAGFPFLAYLILAIFPHYIHCHCLYNHRDSDIQRP